MKYKIRNKTGMRLRYAGIKFEPNEIKVLDLGKVYEHEYFKVEKLKKKSNKNSIKLNEQPEKEEKN